MKAMHILRTTAEDYASKIIPSTLNREEALTPKIEFPLPALSLTEKQCWHIQAPALHAFSPKLHLNWHTARSIIYGPTEYGGIHIPHACFLKSLGQLKLFIGHLRAKDKTSHLIRI